MSQAKDRAEYHVRSVQRALAVLDCFSDENPYLGVSEIASMLDLHKSTVHALLVTMEDAGYISQNTDTGKYFMTYHLFRLGSIVSNNMSIKAIALPYMTALCKKTGESVALNIRHNNRRLVLAVVETPTPVRLFLREGQELLLHASAAGKILLAGMSQDAIQHLIDRDGLLSVTPNTITSRYELLAEIEKVRAQGYALCNGEGYWEAGSVSVGVFDHQGNTIASISIYGPLLHYHSDQLMSFIHDTQECARSISSVYGYSQSVS